MTHEYETILSCKCGEFIVNTAVNSVAASLPGLAPARIYKQPAGEYCFAAQDNVLIKAISICLPFCFCLADERIAIKLMYHRLSDGAGFNLVEIGGYGRIWLFSENIDQELSTFWTWKPAPMPGETNCYFTGSLESHIDPEGAAPFTWPLISMLNVPAALDGTTQPVWSYIRVHHTLPLIDPPAP